MIAVDVVQSLAHLRRCCVGSDLRGRNGPTLARLIMRFNDMQLSLHEILFNYGASGILHDVNEPTGVHYAANQPPAPSFSEAVSYVACVFYLHCLDITDPESYQAGGNGLRAWPILDAVECVEKWDQIAIPGYEMLEAINGLALATKREVVKACQSFKAATQQTKSPPYSLTRASKKPAGGSDSTQRMKLPMAERIAGELRNSDSKFQSGTAEMWAARIAEWANAETGFNWTCSVSTVHRTSAWDATMLETGRRRSGRSVQAHGAFSGKIEATVGQYYDVLEELAAKEEQPAIDAIMTSSMREFDKAATIKKVREGEMTVAEAIATAQMFPPARKRKVVRE